MKTIEVVYKPNNYTAVIMYLIIAAVIFCIVFFKTGQSLISLFITLVIIVVLFVVGYFKKRVVSIKVNLQENKLIFVNYTLYKRQYIELPLNEVIITFKNEVGAKGTIRPSLKIYQKNIQLFDIVPGISGWSSETLKIIAEHVQNVKSI